MPLWCQSVERRTTIIQLIWQHRPQQPLLFSGAVTRLAKHKHNKEKQNRKKCKKKKQPNQQKPTLIWTGTMRIDQPRPVIECDFSNGVALSVGISEKGRGIGYRLYIHWVPTILHMPAFVRMNLEWMRPYSISAACSMRSELGLSSNSSSKKTPYIKAKGSVQHYYKE